MNDVLRCFVSAIIIILPTVGYINTMRLMIRSHTSAPYNLTMVMIIFSGQGLKALYYFYHRFAAVVFGQCIALLICAIALTVLNFRYNLVEVPGYVGQFTPSTRPMLRWLFIGHAKTFTRFTAVLTIYGVIVFAIFWSFCQLAGETPIVEVIGVLANLIEATVSLPIFVRVVVQKQLQDLSIILILQYMFGDIMKIGLFVITEVPFCFIFGAVCQLTVDVTTVVMYLRLRGSQPQILELEEK
jgi:hypothetical protein